MTMTTGVLLLNASFDPIRVIGVPRAFNLVIGDKAEVVEAVPGRVLRSPSQTFPLPSVIRLKYYVNVPQRNATWTRAGVLRRDKFLCQFCGTPLTRLTATIDHLIPKSRGGKSQWGNTCSSCKPCQLRKGDREMHEAGMRFHFKNFEPKIPRVSYLVATSEIDPAWRKYLRL